MYKVIHGTGSGHSKHMINAIYHTCYYFVKIFYIKYINILFH